MTQACLRTEIAKPVRCASISLIPAIVGLLLLSAAALKFFSPTTSSSLPFIYNWFPFILIPSEICLGLWLWSGIRPAAGRLFAVGLFSAFVVFNWSQMKTGVVSCACFGAFSVTPWIALWVDILVVGVLIWWQPVSRQSLTRRQLLGATLLFCVGGILSASATEPKANAGLLEPFPHVLDLGSITQGNQGHADFVVRNLSPEPVVISHIETSCPCLYVRLTEAPIQPGAEARGEAVLDMSHEPRFAGNLAINLEAKTAVDRSAFAMVVTAEILSARE